MGYRLPAAGAGTVPGDVFRNYLVRENPEVDAFWKRRSARGKTATGGVSQQPCSPRPKFLAKTTIDDVPAAREQHPVQVPSPLTQPGLLCFKEGHGRSRQPACRDSCRGRSTSPLIKAEKQHCQEEKAQASCPPNRYSSPPHAATAAYQTEPRELKLRHGEKILIEIVDCQGFGLGKT